MFTVKRSDHNPILSPNHMHPWEALATFNGAPIKLGDKTALLYRAMSEPEKMSTPHMSISTIGVAFSDDGNHFKDRRKLVEPSESFDMYGCEDPRVTYIDGKYYIFYTALGGYPFSKENIKVAVAVSSDLRSIEKKYLVTPFNAKAMIMFPEKVNGKYLVYFSIHTDMPPTHICYAELDSIEDLWSESFWNNWYINYQEKCISLKRKLDDHVEVGSTPVKTDKGWLMFYSHIQRYGKEDQVFGIEALLLDENEHTKLLGRTKGPLLVPEEYYEKIGVVKNITFPTGATLENNELTLYYGAADTYCAKTNINLTSFLRYLVDDESFKLARFDGNPILKKRDGLAWEAKGVLNPGAVEIDGVVYILYRAFSDKNISTIGLAISKDGYNIDERLNSPIYIPRTEFEINSQEGGFAGCEDPRAVIINDKVYITYTAYSGVLPRVAVSHINVEDFVNRDFSKWSDPVIITPMDVDNKDSVIFPRKINGKYYVVHRAYGTICGDYIEDLSFEHDKVNTCIEVMTPRRGMWDGAKVGIATPPIEIEAGYLFFYHGVSWSSIYRLGVALVDKNDPSIVLSRSCAPILEPEKNYEQTGFIPNVVFPTGIVVRDQKVFIYYGAADDSIGVATVDIKTLIEYVS